VSDDDTNLASLHPLTPPSIGTGLFVGSGAILSLVGPAPLFMGYLSMMAVVWCIMNNLAEMVVLLPLKGISIPYLVER
jgi:yeast amino acid transporter